MAVTILNTATLVQANERYLLAEVPSPPPNKTGTADWFLSAGYDFNAGTALTLVAARWTGTRLDFGDSVTPPPSPGQGSWVYQQHNWGNDGASYVQQNYSYDTAVANNGGFTVYTATSTGGIHTEIVSVPDLPTDTTQGVWHRHPVVVAGVGDMVAIYNKAQGIFANDWIVYTYRINDNGTVTSLGTVTGPVELNPNTSQPWGISNFGSGRVDVAPNVIADVSSFVYAGLDPGYYLTRAVNLTNPLAYINCTTLVDSSTGNSWARNGDNRSSDYPVWGYPTAHLLPSGQGFAYRASDGIARYSWTGSNLVPHDVQAVVPPPQGGGGSTYAKPLASKNWYAAVFNGAGTSTNLYYDIVDPAWSALISYDGDPAHGITGLYGGGIYAFEPQAGLLLLPAIPGDFSHCDYYQLGYLPDLNITGQIDVTRVRPYPPKRR